MMKRVILVGGGHAHTQVVRFITKRNKPDNISLVMISESTRTYYSGMLPGSVGKLYSEDETMMHLPPLCELMGWEFIEGRVFSIDPESKALEFTRPDGSRESIEYDVLSLDVGSTTANTSVPGCHEHAMTTRPVNELLDKINAFEKANIANWTAADRDPPSVVVVGGGAAGVELAMGFEARFKKSVGLAKVSIVDRNAQLLNSSNNMLVDILSETLSKKGIQRYHESEPECVTASELVLKDGRRIHHDLVVWATGAAPPGFFQSGLGVLTKTKGGFLAVNEYLQSVSHPEVFGAGDCVSFVGEGIETDKFPPKAGVYAVREGPILAENILNFIKGSSLNCYSAQTDFLSLLMTGDERAIGTKWGVAFEGPWVWRLKDMIDSAWMKSFDIEVLKKANAGEGFKECTSDAPLPVPRDAGQMLADREGSEYRVHWQILKEMSNNEDYRTQVLHEYGLLRSH